MGYHNRPIEKGVLGQLSKIQEELSEAMDAEEQGNKIMLLVELSDLVGAIRGYMDKNFGSTVTFDDLLKMSDATKRAFETGGRR